MAKPAKNGKDTNRYTALIEKIFFDHWRKGITEFIFRRDEIKSAAATLGIKLPDNLGDVIYSFRFRTKFSERILATRSEGMEWRIELAGRSTYKFVLGRESRIVPNSRLVRVKIPDSTPELINSYALDDEQALLAIVRYNRLIDIFLGITTYSLQNHLRTTVKGVGQIEIDELYVGVDTHGCHYVVPVQAKAGKDKISIVQTAQDIRYCEQAFSGIKCLPISVQFLENDVIALFQLTVQDGEIRVRDERHYLLVPSDEINPDAIKSYKN